MLRRKIASTLAALGLVAIAGACTKSASEAAEETTTSTTTTSTTTSTTTTIDPYVGSFGSEGVLTSGSEGELVVQSQLRLNALAYDAGDPDGVYDQQMHHAVMAFQKVNGLERTGSIDPLTASWIASPPPIAPLTPDAGPTRVEVELDSQTLRYWQDGVLVRVLSISSGNGRRYCEKGNCGVANTPNGTFKIQRRIPGKRVSDLGVLFNPIYFKGGFAIHGAPSVPPYPASHGCVRVPMVSSNWVYDNIHNGTPVVIFHASEGYSPAPLPADEFPTTTTAPAPANESTTTTPVPTTTTTLPAAP